MSQSNNDYNLYQCRYEVIRKKNKRMKYTCHIVSTSPEMVERWLEGVVGKMDICVCMKIYDIDGITDDIVEGISVNNYERIHQKKMIIGESNNNSSLGCDWSIEEKLERIPQLHKVVRWFR